MGLDFVELVMRLEEDFKISISDSEAGEVQTVGDLFQVVINHLNLGDGQTCMTSASFYRTRRALIQSLGVERRSVRPTTLLDDLFPQPPDRAAAWKEFTKASTLKIPDIETGWLLRGSIFPVGTVGDLANRVATLNHAQLRQGCGSWNIDEAWKRFEWIVRDELGVDPEKIKKEARIVDDLGVD